MPNYNDNMAALHKPTKEDVNDFLALRKAVVREMEWVPSPSKKSPGWDKFESKCYLGSEINEETDFRAQYRKRSIQHRGGATIEIPEAFYVSIWIRNHRVYAIDTNPGQTHTNAIVPGLPYSGAMVSAATHEHIWTMAADDYVQPVEPPLLDLRIAIEKFCQRVNLYLNGHFQHPAHGQTEQLI